MKTAKPFEKSKTDNRLSNLGFPAVVLYVDGAWERDDESSTSQNSVDDHLRRGLLDVHRRVSSRCSGQLVSRHGTPPSCC